MALEIGAIERSRRVESQAWCFFFSAQKIREARAPQSRAFRENIMNFPVGMRYLRRISTSLFIHWALLQPGVNICARLISEHRDSGTF